MESVVFKDGVDDDTQTDSVHSVQSDYTSYAGSPAVLGASGVTILNKIPGIPCFLGTEREKDTFQFEQWYHAISDARRNFNEQLVRVATTKSWVGDVADAICYHQGFTTKGYRIG